MNRELMEKAKGEIGKVHSDTAVDYLQPDDYSGAIISAVLRVAVMACAEIAERDSVLDWAGGSTGNAVGTRIKIHKQIRALLTDDVQAGKDGKNE